MDYPAPLVGIRADSTLDFSNAYATGVGAWDVQQVRYAYTQFAPGADEAAGLEAILRENRVQGYRYLSDDDTRPAGAAPPPAPRPPRAGGGPRTRSPRCGTTAPTRSRSSRTRWRCAGSHSGHSASEE